MSTTTGKKSAQRGAKRSVSKEPHAKKEKGAKSSNKYDYVELSKASLTQAAKQNIYGVIIDATFPYKSSKSFYICSIKIVDPSLHIKNTKGTGDGSDYATLILYANRFEDLPIISRVGDIIRVHRTILRLHNHQRQFNANVFVNSSWALFSTEKNDNAPSTFYGKHFTFDKQDATLLSNLRKWATQYFTSYNVMTNDMQVALKDVQKEKADFDVLAKITNIHEMDEYTNELKLRDQSGLTWYTLALKLKFPYITAGDVVRIRSATVDETSKKRVLVLSHYSNIMTFISSSKIAKEIKAKVHDEKNPDKAALKKGVNMNAVVLTEVDKKYANLASTPLSELFHHADTDPELQNKNTFRTTFQVIKIEPSDVKEWTKSYDKKTKQSTSLKGGKGGNAIYQVQFLVKDASTQTNNHTYRVLLYTHDNLGANFFGVNADNLHKNDGARKKLEEQAELLTKFNSWVDAVVERKNGFYFIKDTKFVA